MTFEVGKQRGTSGQNLRITAATQKQRTKKQTGNRQSNPIFRLLHVRKAGYCKKKPGNLLVTDEVWGLPEMSSYPLHLTTACGGASPQGEALMLAMGSHKPSPSGEGGPLAVDEG